MILYKLVALVGVDGWRQIKFLCSTKYKIDLLPKVWCCNRPLGTARLTVINLYHCHRLTRGFSQAIFTGECGAVSNRHILSVSHIIFTHLGFS